MVQIFPNTDSLLRLMGAVTMEYGDEQIKKQRIFTAEKLREIENSIYVEFSNIATKQKEEMSAA